MDLKKLSKVTDAISKGRVEIVSNTNRTYSSSAEEMKKIHDNNVSPKVVTKKVTQIVICDSKFMKEFDESTRDKKREFLSKMSDSQRSRFLKLQRKLMDSAFSERLGLILLDNLVYNFLVDPTKRNEEDLREFIQTQDYLELPEDVLSDVNKLLDGSVDTPTHLIDAVKEAVGKSSVEDISKEPEESYDEPTDQDIDEMEDSATEIAVQYDIDCDLDKLMDSVSGYNTKGKNFNRTKVQDVMFKKILDTIHRDPYDFGTVISDKKDLNDIYAESKSETDSPIDSLIEALQSYKEGDDSKLNELINKETTDEDLDDIDDPTVDADTGEEKEPTEDEEQEFLVDSVGKVAYGVLNNKNVNKLINALKKRKDSVELTGYMKSECQEQDDGYEEVQGVPDIPLEYNEYRTLVQSPIGVPILEKAAVLTGIPVVKTIEPQGNLVNINNGCLYIPITGSAEEVCADSSSLDGKIVAVDALKKAATIFDALSVVSKRFYKKKLTSNNWVFDKDRKPWCIPDDYKSCEITRAYKGQGDFTIFGVPYKYV